MMVKQFRDSSPKTIVIIFPVLFQSRMTLFLPQNTKGEVLNVYTALFQQHHRFMQVIACFFHMHKPDRNHGGAFKSVVLSSQVPNKNSGSSLKKPLENKKAGSVKKEKSANEGDGKCEYVKHSLTDSHVVVL